jgi:hypothetical protein
VKRMQFTVVGGRRLVCVDGSPWLPVTKELDTALGAVERLLAEAQRRKAEEQTAIAKQRDTDMEQVRQLKRAAVEDPVVRSRGRVGRRRAAIAVANEWTAARLKG